MADRGRRAMPVGNRLCEERWTTKNLDRHHERLRSMGSTPKRCKSVDNTFPDTMALAHLKINAKKKQMEKERKMAVDLENQKLLERLVQIQRRDIKKQTCAIGGKHVDEFPYRSSMQISPGMRLNAFQYPVIDCASRELPKKSLNGESRRNELNAIMDNNIKMLNRLQNQRAIYSTAKLNAEYEVARKYGQNARSREVAAISKTMQRRQWTPQITPRGNRTEDFLVDRPLTASLPEI